MISKIPGIFQKTFFTLVLFLLTDAGQFSHLINFLSRKPYVRHAIKYFTGLPINKTGAVFQAWSAGAVSFSLAIAFWFILLAMVVRPGLFVKIYRSLWDNAAIVALLVFAGSSWFWSVSPVATLNGVFLALELTVVGIYLTQIYSYEEILDLLVWVVALACILSMLAVWQIPGSAVGRNGWVGIYSAKNYLGRLMAFGNAMLVLYWLRNKENLFKRILALFFFILTGVLLIFSDSVTSLVTLLGMIGALLLYGVWKKWIRRFSLRTQLFFGVFGAGIGVSLIVNYEHIFALLHRSPTLTGRMSLWPRLWIWLEKRPLFGFGYHAFWEQMSKPLLGWARHAHNGYLEVALGLGLSGLVIFLIALLITWKRALIVFRQKRQITYFWPILALIYFTLANMAYSIAFENPDFHWALFVIVAGTVATAALEETREPSPTGGT